MDIVRTPTQMHQWIETHPRLNSRGFVPTMGALHRGHETLLQHCRENNDQTVLSIFVNPTQFNVASDYDKYPRNFERDLAVAEHHGVDVVYMPTSSDMYPEHFRSFVDPGIAADPMEGAGRPGHFRGVTTVVAKLFNAVCPDVAYFGKKDFQQLAVVHQMVSELNFHISIIGVETIRDEDGLALSSRNQRLSSAARKDAPIIYQSLKTALKTFERGERNSDVLLREFHRTLSQSTLIRLEYAVISDATTLQKITHVTQTAVLCVAAWYDDVRLIDNIEFII